MEMKSKDLVHGLLGGISSGLKKSNVLNPLGSKAREYRSTSESAGTQPEW
jgi:hypothetical protein